MDLRHLRYFVAAVEEGSLQGAAQRMNVAQPALSRRIRDLEAELACELLIRGARGVTPTKAGAGFYRDVVGVFESLEQARQRARQAGLQQNETARLGLVQTSRKFSFIHDAIAEVKQSYPNLNIDLQRGASNILAASLKEGELDLALLYEQRPGAEGFRERIIHKENYVLAMHPSHALVGSTPLPLSALAGEPLVWLSRQDNPDNHDALLQHCRQHGVTPIFSYTAATQEEQIDLVVASGGACLTLASTMLSTAGHALKFRPIQNFTLEVQFLLAWRLGLEDSPALHLLEALHGAIDTHQARIVEGKESWTHLNGKRLVSVPEPATAP